MNLGERLQALQRFMYETFRLEKVGLSVCRSVGLSDCRSVRLSVCRTVGLSDCRSVGRWVSGSVGRLIYRRFVTSLASPLLAGK